MEDPPAVTVVVCCRGDWSGRIAVAEAMRRQTYPADSMELIVVNNQRSGTREIATSLDLLALRFSWRVEEEPKAGLSRARNTGVRAAKGEYVVITDPDIVPSDTWIETLIRAHVETDARCVGGAVQSRYDDRPAMTLTRTLRECHGPVDWPPGRVEAGAPYWITGCNLSFHRRTALQEVGLFRVDLGRIGRRKGDCEDLEFVARMNRWSGQAVIEPAATVEHPVGRHETTPGYFVRQGIGHGRSLARMESTVSLWAEPSRPSTARVAAALYGVVRRGRDTSPSTAEAVTVVRDFAVYLSYRAERLRLRAIPGAMFSRCRTQIQEVDW